MQVQEGACAGSARARVSALKKTKGNEKHAGFGTDNWSGTDPCKRGET